MTGIIGKKSQEYEWKKSSAGSNARRQSTNDILSTLKEKHRRPSEEALFSSGKKVYFVLSIFLGMTLPRFHLRTNIRMLYNVQKKKNQKILNALIYIVVSFD